MKRLFAFLIPGALLTGSLLADSTPVISYDWTSHPVSNYRNFSRGWADGTTVTKHIAFSDTEPLSPSPNVYSGPLFYGAGSYNLTGTLDGSTPATISGPSRGRVANQPTGDEIEASINSFATSEGGENTVVGAMLYYWKSPAPFQVGDTSLYYQTGNYGQKTRFQWVLRDATGAFFVSDMSLRLTGAGDEHFSNSLTTRRWAPFDPTQENLIDGIGEYADAGAVGLDFNTITGAGVLIIQNQTLTDSGTQRFYATVRHFRASPHDAQRDRDHLSVYYFGNSLTASTAPQAHLDLGATAGKRWQQFNMIGAGWQLWQHRYQVYVGGAVSQGGGGGYTLDPSQIGDLGTQLDEFTSEPLEAVVLQQFGSVMWDEVVTQKWDITFPEPTDVSDRQSADDLIAATLAYNPAASIHVYTQWHTMPKGPVPPEDEWPEWTENFVKPEEFVPGELHGEFPDRDSFVFDEQFLRFYQSEDPPWINVRNVTRDYRHQLFVDIISRYPDLWAEGRLHMIPTGEVFRRLDTIYQAGGDPELDNPAVPEKIMRIADLYADSLHVRGGLTQFLCAAAFYTSLYGEHPDALDWTLYNDPSWWGDDPTHDATPLLLITEARARQVCDVIWEVFTSHPFTRLRQSPFDGTDPNAQGMASAWGENADGELGREELAGDATTPVALNDRVTAIPGEGFAFFLAGDGSVASVGRNESGQLGDATIAPRRFPWDGGVLPPVSRIASSPTHAAAVSQSGAVWAWGANADGQLGSDFGRFGHVEGSGDSLFPVPPRNPLPAAVAGIPSPATDVACGDGFTLALLADGTVQAWGRDAGGQLGDGSPDATGRSTPQAVSGLSNIARIAAGLDFALALDGSGVVYAWGDNASGQLGASTPASSATPLPVSGLPTIERIAAGDSFALALDENGRVWAWGDNASGQCGLDPASQPILSQPVPLADFGEVTSLAAGSAHALALLADATVQAWGANDSGQLGDGTTTPRHAPAPVAGLDRVKRIAAAGNQSTARNWGLRVVDLLEAALTEAQLQDPELADVTKDPDGDDVPTLIELLGHSDPLDATSRFGSLEEGAGVIRFHYDEVDGVEDQNLLPEQSIDLMRWDPLDPALRSTTPGPDGILEHVITLPPDYGPFFLRFRTSP